MIGHSVLGRPIEAYQLGDGPVPLIVVGGVHGGYEWNTVLLARELIDRVTNRSIEIPAYLSLFVVPSANPDGIAAVTGGKEFFAAQDVMGDTTAGRTNSHGVDLNRNWDCNWQPSAEWRGGSVSAGAEPFSEPEVSALRDFIDVVHPAAVVFWHSAASGVFAGGCGFQATYEEGKRLARMYADAAGYVRNASDATGSGSFTAYPITGDAANWVSRQGIPALVVELKTHNLTEFEQNWRGLNTLFDALKP